LTTSFPAGTPIVIVRQNQDRFQNWTDGEKIPVTCAIDYTTSTEDSTDRETVRQEATLYAPAGTVFLATDRIQTPDGARWQVVGSPNLWQQPITGWSPGVAVHIELVSG